MSDQLWQAECSPHLSKSTEHGLDSASCTGVDARESLGFPELWGRTPENPPSAATGIQLPARQKVATPE